MLTDGALLEIARRLVGATAAETETEIERLLGVVMQGTGADGVELWQRPAAHAPPDRTHVRPVGAACVPDLAWALPRLLDGQAVIAQRDDAEPAARRALDAAGLHALIAAPMVAASEVVGALVLHWRSATARAGPLGPLLVAGELLAQVSARVTVERELRVARDRLHTFVASTREAVVCFEIPGGIALDQPFDAQLEQLMDAPLVECNVAYARLKRVDDPSALVGRRLRELTVLTRAQLSELYSRIIAGGYRAEFEVTNGEGTFRFRAQAMVSGGRLTHWWSLLSDVTEERKAEALRASLEAQLRHAQKMESIGVMAGGVAHDFNNILLVIDGESTLVSELLLDDPVGAERSLAQIRRASARAAELTRRLLTFSRQQAADHKPTDVEAMVTGVLSMLRRMVRAEVKLELRAHGPLAAVRGDVGQLEQVVMNLAVNAADAISGVGRILIEVDAVVLDEAYARLHPWARPGRFVRLAVTDDGPGIPPELRERVFEPFFTTKPSGKGTGLGLSMVYGIVQQHGGFVHLYSEVGSGSTFRVYLPADETAAAPAPQAVAAPVPNARGHETILVAEDDPLVRNVVQRILGRAGYRVILAQDGAEALELLEARASEIQLLLLDAVMPRVSGDQVYARARVERPSLPIIVSSGYTAGSFLDGAFAEPILTKPYDAKELLARVRRALDDAADGTTPPSP